jgi:hypothetical protein
MEVKPLITILLEVGPPLRDREAHRVTKMTVPTIAGTLFGCTLRQ